MPKPDIITSPIAETDYAGVEFVRGGGAHGEYARTEYLDALSTATGGRFAYWACDRAKQLLGGVGLYEENTRFGRLVSPRLLLTTTAPCYATHDSKYPSEQTSRSLKTLTALESELRAAGYGQIRLKPRSVLGDVRPFLSNGWSGNQGYTYVVPITNLEQTRARIEQNLRRLIDRCARSEMTFTVDNDFDSFFSLHSSTMERVDFRVYLSSPAFRRFYETLARQGLAQLFHARLPDGRSVASQLVLLGHPVTHTVAAGADPEHIKSGVTAFLRWRVFEYLSEAGYQANDLTDASLNPVTHFKSQLGEILEPWVEVRSPLSPRFRWGQRATNVARSGRGALSAVLRRGSGAAKDE